jgi:propionate CoA-transferase
VKLCSATDAAAQVGDGATVATTGSGGGVLEPYALLAAIEERFLRTGGPVGLTFVHALGLGDRDRKGASALAHDGLVKRVICGHWTWSPQMMELAAANKIEAYAMPSGVISSLFRESGAGRPGLFTRTGIETFADPRQRGCRANDAARQEIVTLTRICGREYLHYAPLAVDVALVRGTEVDNLGNIGARYEAALLDVLEVAQAAKGNGGIVIAQVKRRRPEPLDPREVVIPAAMVDYVVVAEDQWQTYASEEDRGLFDAPTPSDSVDEIQWPSLGHAIVARRAALEVPDNCVLNLGFGMSAGVADALREEGRHNQVRLAIEQGLFDGRPATGDLFGMSRGPSARISSTVQFDLFAAGLLDVCALGMAQADGIGNVNVSRFGGQVIGPGGFVDISQYARTAVFCGSFTAKGLSLTMREGNLQIVSEGAVPKFVESVDEITYSGALACNEGRRALYVTERAVFELTSRGIELTEVAPGIDVERDVLAQMRFPPVVNRVRAMPASVFRPVALRPRRKVGRP